MWLFYSFIRARASEHFCFLQYLVLPVFAFLFLCRLVSSLRYLSIFLPFPPTSPELSQVICQVLASVFRDTSRNPSFVWSLLVVICFQCSLKTSSCDFCNHSDYKLHLSIKHHLCLLPISANTFTFIREILNQTIWSELVQPKKKECFSEGKDIKKKLQCLPISSE